MKKTVQVSVVSSGIISLIVFCISTIIFLDQAFEGPPSPSKEPTIQEIIGIYRLSDGSINELKDSGYIHIPSPSDCYIILREDRTFVSKNLPDMMWLYGNAKNGFYSVSGIWEPSQYGIWLEIAELDGIASDEKIGLNFYGKEPPFSIYFLISELHWLVFEKSSAQ